MRRDRPHAASLSIAIAITSKHGRENADRRATFGNLRITWRGQLRVFPASGRKSRANHFRQIDLRIGGRWRWVMIANGGFEVAFSSEYREIERPRRLVKTEVFEAVPDAEGVSTTTFSPL